MGWALAQTGTAQTNVVAAKMPINRVRMAAHGTQMRSAAIGKYCDCVNQQL
jgi:hypothetical protein